MGLRATSLRGVTGNQFVGESVFDSIGASSKRQLLEVTSALLRGQLFFSHPLMLVKRCWAALQSANCMLGMCSL